MGDQNVALHLTLSGIDKSVQCYLYSEPYVLERSSVMLIFDANKTSYTGGVNFT